MEWTGGGRNAIFRHAPISSELNSPPFAPPKEGGEATTDDDEPAVNKDTNTAGSVDAYVGGGWGGGLTTANCGRRRPWTMASVRLAAITSTIVAVSSALATVLASRPVPPP